MSMPAEHLTATMTLADLLQGIVDAPTGVPAIPVHGISSDSRRLEEGDVFLAVQGLTSHGLDFLAEAAESQVAAVVWDSSTGATPADIGIPTIAVPELASRLGEIADRFYGEPSAALGITGITGTNGKTTVAWMIAQAGELLGNRCGYLGTLGFGVGELQGDEGMTTPATIELHGRLAEFAGQGASQAAIEVSSHALAQGRVDGVRFDTAIFTNLTRDHLDYHRDMRDYFDSKARLFLDCSPKHRIVNLDSEYGEQLAARCGQEVITVSTNFTRVANGRPYVFVRSVVANQGGSDVSFTSSWGDGRFELRMPGDFNVANALLVLALMLNNGIELARACDVMAQLSAPPGRMQRVAGNGPAAYVDYAHTPHALEVALRALRPHTRGKLWCVFGCGGDRDTGKRPQMGKAAEHFADQVVVTSDNPRSEDPQSIIEDIVAGFARPERATIVEDRAAAIAWALQRAADNDVVLIAGKGHENYQEIGAEQRPFSDYAVAAAALRKGEGAV
ncbi:MAG: UDP-N-acetylmuramoyl-L-alanyl-D-glutamate--2,6-diaminopimelate ligase [Woeseiaceae bacterium]|nr:UDP-N-acetylmuramoyl-L-alanyl-D-glutamate--2,6-diaminopimelate ligase [Woeseiaceae bacterium]